MAYIDPSIVAQVKQIDLLSYLQEYEPDELVRVSATTYATKTHDSLKLSNGKWYWWSRGFGGKSALDYLIKVRDMSFINAVNHLATRSSLPAVQTPTPKALAPKPKPFKLPLKHSNSVEAITYLRSRKIALNIIQHCISGGLIYETKSLNQSRVVFVGFDKQGVAKCASIRGCGGNFKGEAKGSNRRYPFLIKAQKDNSTVHIFESAIDALSYATLMQGDSINWHNASFLSLDGIPPENARQKTLPAALDQFFIDNKNTSLACLCLDTDKPGLAATKRIAAALQDRCEVNIVYPPKGKDWNEYLMQVNDRSKTHGMLTVSPKKTRGCYERG